MVVAGTGHRPPYLLWGYKEEHPLIEQLKADISRTLHSENVSFVISGMASGFDIYLAEVALEEGFKLDTYTVEGQTDSWPIRSAKKWRRIVEQSTNYPIASVYSVGNKAYYQRDMAMVEDSDFMIALLNPEVKKGGTYLTVKAAKKMGKRVINLWKPEYAKEKK